MKPFKLNSELDNYVEAFDSDTISAIRIILLDKVAEQIYDELIEKGQAKLNFICTHNSRRSQIAQIWSHVASSYFGLNILSYSGGSEATAFNERAIAAMQRIGFNVISKGKENPINFLYYSEEDHPITTFSKKFDDAFNPASDALAIMVCSDADENCPFIPQAKLRIALRYKDPKIADDTENESNLYDERVHQIGTEIFYIFEQIKLNLPT